MMTYGMKYKDNNKAHVKKYTPELCRTNCLKAFDSLCSSLAWYFFSIMQRNQIVTSLENVMFHVGTNADISLDRISDI